MSTADLHEAIAAAAAPFDFDNSYPRLPERFHARIAPTPVAAPRLVAFNAQLADELGLRVTAASPDAAAIFAGNRLPPGAMPIAMAYAGHQFGQFVPQLGDGRAILLGEVLDRHRQRRDIQLKGAGPTPFSRGGDGRSPLGPALREYLVSEAMHALGIPTTRALALVTSGEPVYREVQLPGALLTRVAASHVRVGTFQYFAARNDVDGIRRLADHVLARHYAHAIDSDYPYRTLLASVIERQAYLIARWMQVGFVHGVMNTDNMAVSGETIDYGPCAFLDGYLPARAFSFIDHGNRYAYANQPRVAQWNLARFAETLLPLLDADEATAVEHARAAVDDFGARFREHWLAGVSRKLGLASVEDGDAELADDLLDLMRDSEADFTVTFRRLCRASLDSDAHAGVRRLFTNPAAYDRWAARWQQRLDHDPQAPAERAQRMQQTNPAVIPRNHRVEQAIRAAIEHDDFDPFDALRNVLAQPYVEQPDSRAYAEPPRPSERVHQTFCGT